MWIFTKAGFMSVVHDIASANEHDFTGGKHLGLVVRFRDYADANRFAGACPVKGGPRRVHVTPDRDYPYRCFVPRKRFARWLAKQVVDELDYSNFKSEVANQYVNGYGEPNRAHLYGEIWHVLREGLDARARRKRTG